MNRRVKKLASSSNATAAGSSDPSSTWTDTTPKAGPDPMSSISSSCAESVIPTFTPTQPGPKSTDSWKETGALLIKLYAGGRDEGIKLQGLMVMMLLPGVYQDISHKSGIPQQNLWSIITSLIDSKLVKRDPRGVCHLTEKGIEKLTRITDLCKNRNPN